MTDWFEYRWIGFGTILVLLSGIGWYLGLEPRAAFLIAFDIAGAIFLCGLGLFMAFGGAARLQEEAVKVDAGRWTVLLMGVVLSSAALVSLALEIQDAEHATLAHLPLAAASILVAWLLMNTIFAFHYAHLYYVDGREPGGLSFPGTVEPDYFDFLYFALVIGMTFQVSDVTIVDARTRRVALGHAVIAFFFNVVVLALSVNMIGLLA